MRIEHGGDIYRNNIQHDFSVNINPLGMTEKCRQEAMRGIEQSSHYPDVNATKLREAIANKYFVNADAILVGNGAAELIYALCHALKPKQARALAPTFQEYEAAVRMSGGKMIYTLLSEEKDWLVDDTFADCISEKDDLVFVCNPNNPTGKRVDKEVLARLVEKCKQVNAYLVIDECFLPFIKQEDEYSYFKASCQKHVIVLRAFTKIYAMAGIRLGYMLVGDEDLREKTVAQMQPWNTSVSAQLAGVAALDEDDFVDATIDLISRERKNLTNGLQPYVHKVYDSDANFLLVKAGEDFADRLLEEGVLIRSCKGFAGLDGTFFRIAVRTYGENEQLLQILSRIYKKDI